MLVTDLMHSCMNERVAEAAVLSIGGEFALRILADAEEGGLGVGGFTAGRIRQFAASATERDWRELAVAVRGQDHPLLVGLQLILSRRITTLEVYRRGSESRGLRGASSAGYAIAAA